MENNARGLNGTAFKTFNCFLGYIAAEITNDIIDYWGSTKGNLLHLLNNIKYKPQTTNHTQDLDILNIFLPGSQVVVKEEGVER